MDTNYQNYYARHACQEANFSAVCAVPLIGIPVGLIRAILGLTQAISGGFNFTQKDQSLSHHGWIQIKHGLSNIVAGCMEAIPFIGTISAIFRNMFAPETQLFIAYPKKRVAGQLISSTHRPASPSCPLPRLAPAFEPPLPPALIEIPLPVIKPTPPPASFLAPKPALEPVLPAASIEVLQPVIELGSPPASLLAPKPALEPVLPSVSTEELQPVIELGSPPLSSLILQLMSEPKPVSNIWTDIENTKEQLRSYEKKLAEFDRNAEWVAASKNHKNFKEGESPEVWKSLVEIHVDQKFSNLKMMIESMQDTLQILERMAKITTKEDVSAT